jgi:glutamine amidotransferase
MVAMCRIAVYLGPEIALRNLLTLPEHSLLKQSWQPRELKYAKLNADGYGYAWFDGNGHPLRYIYAEPIWADPNLHELASGLSSDLWLAFIRSASEGFGNHSLNTQPFRDDSIVFMHNGYIEDFNQSLRPELLQRLPHDIQAGIQGNTDSEYLFALIRWMRSTEPDTSLPGLLEQCLDWVGRHIHTKKALLNLTLSDGRMVATCRHAFNDDAPSLYYSTADTHFPLGAQLIASEPLYASDAWHRVPESHMLCLNRDTPPELKSF